MLRNRLLSAAPLWLPGLALVRVLAGGLMAHHGLAVFDAAGMREMADWLGSDLHLPAPTLMAYLAKGSEFLGGLLVALGLLTRPACLLVVVTMAVAALGAHGDDLPGKGEAASLYLLLFTALFFSGPGPWSLDYALFDRRP